jgi:diguanylate cyclase (GGDEF)-like protein
MLNISGSRMIRLFSLCMACILLMPAFVCAEEKEKVRVGFYNSEQYHALDSLGRHTGYHFEYLGRIADCTGWEYEFVEGTLDECLEMMERGEIDLLGGVERTPERETFMTFSGVPTFCAANCLLQPAQSNQYNYGDYKAYEGMRIGLVRSSALNDSLKRYSEEKGFHYLAFYYDTSEEMRRALKNGEIDCICMGSNRNLSDYTVLDYFGYSRRYYAVRRDRPDLAEQLDNALEQIWVRDPEFEFELYQKYFEYSNRVAFTPAEEAYIQRGEPVQVGLYMQLGKLFCRYDKKEQRYAGLMIDVLNELSVRTGLQFEYSEIPADQYPEDYLKEHPDALIAPDLRNNLITTIDGYMLLDPIMKGRMVTIGRAGVAYMPEDNFTLAVPLGLYHNADKLGQIFPNARIASCISHSEGMEMVAHGDADIALANEFTAAYQLQSPLYDDLRIIEMADITEDMTMSMALDSDPELVSILKKGIFSLGERDIREIVVKNTAATSYEKSWLEWIYEYRYNLTLTVIILALCTAGLIQRKKYSDRRREDEQRLQISDAQLKTEQEYRKLISHQARHDELTGLYNQGYFIQKANERLKQYPETIHAFLRINVKNFKMLNDLYGVEAGDFVLCEIAKLIRQTVEQRGVYCRLYADQFAICMPVNMEQLKQYLKPNSAHTVRFKEQEIQYRLEVGMYVDDKHCLNAAWAIDCAQIALQSDASSENAYGGRLAVFKDAYLKDMRLRQKISLGMEKALQEEQFHVYLQPQFNIISHTLVGAEALVRWIHPQYGMISPAVFIPVLESNRFIYRLDAYMCDRICGLLAGWLARGKAVPVSLNLSQVDLCNPELIPMLQNTLKKHAVPIEYLHLEITESAYVADRSHAMQTVEKLQKVSFCVEMDDFGSGYSSLNMLKDLPVNVLKMDMGFLGDESNMDRGGSIIHAVVQGAHALGMPVIAEGVEKEREANFLKSIGCRFVQGYLYSKPMPAEEFAEYLEHNEISEKKLNDRPEGIDGLYWKMEQYEVLLQNDGIILFDYVPELDQATFAYIDEKMRRQEIIQTGYAASLMENPRVHPEYRELLRRALQGEESGKVELDFLGDADGKESYEWFHATIYHYRRNHSHRRTIALLKRKSGDAPDSLFTDVI